MKHKKFLQIFIFTIIIGCYVSLQAPLPTSRDGDLNDELSPCKVIQTNLLSQLLSVALYESTYKGALCVCNNGGPNHNDPTIHCWNYPLTISDSNATFDGVSIVKIKENITFKPTQSGSCTGVENLAAIIVEKDDMTIDLSGFAISMDGSTLTPNPPTICPVDNSCTDPGCVPRVHGIYIKPGVKNTRIISTVAENTHIRGSFKKFTGFGIFIKGGTAAGQQVEEVFVNNIRIYNCYGGISAENASNINITRTEANNNCQYNTLYGMRFVNVSELYVVGCQASSNRSCNNVYGIYMEDTCNSCIEDTECSKNRSLATVASSTGSVYGIHVTASSATTSFTNKLHNCTTNSNISGADISSECVGIYLGSLTPASFAGTAHNIVQNCTVLGNLVTDTTSPPDAFGIKLENSNYNEISNNQIGFNANTAPTGSTSVGIIDTLQTTGSTSLFVSNRSFFNGFQGSNNYSVLLKPNLTSNLKDLATTIIYAANLNAVATTTSLENFDIRKAP